MKTQSWYIQTVHTLWDPILFTIVLTLKLIDTLLTDVFKMYICNKLLSICRSEMSKMLYNIYITNITSCSWMELLMVAANVVTRWTYFKL